MHFRVLPDLFQRFPTVCVGLVVAQGVRNDRPSPGLTELLRAAEQETRRRFAAHGARDEPALAVWRAAFTELGYSQGRFKSSVEALVTRVLKGTPLPELNPVVDLVNALSLTYLLPIGAHDLAQVRGDLEVGPARAGAHFTPLGQVDRETVDEGEFVYADAQEVRTRRWVWRQSDRSKVVVQSDTIVFPIDGWLGKTDVAVRAAQGDLVRYLEAELGARTRTFFLDRDHPSAVILDHDALPDTVLPVDGGFRMAGLGYTERLDLTPALSPSLPYSPLPGAPEPAATSHETRWKVMDPVDALLNRATVHVEVRAELETRLRRGDRLRVKFGVDPTSPHLHLGHAVVLRKLRAFQHMGHTICLLIGDFTAQIGDASDKIAQRQMLSEEQVVANMITYRKQIARILDEDAVEWSYNSDWLGSLRFKDVVGLAANFTVAQMLERENFTNRYAGGQAIGLQEFLYPLMQGYDSVALRADVELGGTEQLFNLLAGRTLQRAFGQPPQAVMTCALLLGLDGRKMSKSFGNAVGLEDSPRDMFGKVMGFPDEQIVPGFELCTDIPLEEIGVFAEQLDAGAHPMELKKQLAYEITRLYHGEAHARRAQETFERVVQRREGPAEEDSPEVILPHGDQWPLVDLLVTLELVKSKSEARQKIRERGVKINREVVADPQAQVEVREGMIVLLGKRNSRMIRLPS